MNCESEAKTFETTRYVFFFQPRCSTLDSAPKFSVCTISIIKFIENELQIVTMNFFWNSLRRGRKLVIIIVGPQKYPICTL